MALTLDYLTVKYLAHLMVGKMVVLLALKKDMRKEHYWAWKKVERREERTVVMSVSMLENKSDT